MKDFNALANSTILLAERIAAGKLLKLSAAVKELQANFCVNRRQFEGLKGSLSRERSGTSIELETDLIYLHL